MVRTIAEIRSAEAVRHVVGSIFGKRFGITTFAIAVSFFVVADWLPSGIRAIIAMDWKDGILMIAVSALIILFWGLALNRVANNKTKLEVEYVQSPPVSVLGMFLSVISMNPRTQTEKIAEIQTAIEIKNDPESIINGTSWEMPIGAIRHHLPELKKLCVVTSNDTKSGTHELMPLFQSVVKAVFPGAVIEIVELTPCGIDFEDVKTVFEVTDRFYKECRQNGKGGLTCLFDITGGQKLTSIAGAMAALSEGRKFQYISTKDTSKINSYDVITVDVDE